MSVLLAFCGLDCAECPARTATITDDVSLKASTAAAWSKEFGFAFTPEMIHCTGCREAGAKIGHCGECAMRACGLKKGLAHCGECPDYGICPTLGDFLRSVPAAKVRLDTARGTASRGA